MTRGETDALNALIETAQRTAPTLDDDESDEREVSVSDATRFTRLANLDSIERHNP